MPTNLRIMERYLLRYTFLAAPYATVVSVLYLLGYWSRFKINIFNYIALSDVLKLTLLPLIVVLIGSAIFGLAMFYHPSPLPMDRNNFQRPRGRDFLLAVLSLLVLVPMWFVTRDLLKWSMIGSLSTLILSFLLQRLEISKSLIQNNRLRFALAILFVSPLSMSFVIGRAVANSIPTDNTRLVSIKILKEYGSEPFSKKQLLDGQEELIYIGTANDYVFFLSRDNSKTYIFKFSDIHFLELKNF